MVIYPGSERKSPVNSNEEQKTTVPYKVLYVMVVLVVSVDFHASITSMQNARRLVRGGPHR